MQRKPVDVSQLPLPPHQGLDHWANGAGEFTIQIDGQT